MTNFTNIVLALEYLCKGAKVNVLGDSLDSIEWLDNEIKRPNNKNILEAIIIVQTMKQKELRKEEIFKELDRLDLKLIRPMSENDDVRISVIKGEKEALRTELQGLIDV